MYQEQRDALDTVDAENPHTHKDTAGQWVQKPKKKNVVTLTIERYARERGFARSPSDD